MKFPNLLCLSLLLAGLALPRAVRAQEADYRVTVEKILVRGEQVARTDIAVVSTGETEEHLASGLAIEPGKTVKLLYPGVVVYLDDGQGNRILLECDLGSPESPLELVIGNPGKREGFRQKRGKVQYKVAPEEGWFEVLFDVLRGPEEEIVPIGVEGTHFLLESLDSGFSVTVAKGVVAVGKADTELHYSLGAERSLQRVSGELVEGPAGSAVLELMRSSFGAGSVVTSGSESFQSSSSSSSLVSAGAWTTIGVGALITAAGGVLHVLAVETNYELRDEADSMCGGGLGGYTGSPLVKQDGQEYYDREFDEQVRPKRTAARVLYVVGGATLAGGIIWLLADTLGQIAGAAADSGPGFTVTPAFGDGGAKMMLQFQF